MFLISMPLDFKVGDTANVRIKKKPAMVRWSDSETLIIDDMDIRKVLDSRVHDGLRKFVCADSDGTPRGVRVHKDGLGNILIEAKD
jgi:hypothetical protein